MTYETDLKNTEVLNEICPNRNTFATYLLWIYSKMQVFTVANNFNTGRPKWGCKVFLL